MKDGSLSSCGFGTTEVSSQSLRNHDMETKVKRTRRTTHVQRGKLKSSKKIHRLPCRNRRALTVSAEYELMLSIRGLGIKFSTQLRRNYEMGVPPDGSCTGMGSFTPRSSRLRIKRKHHNAKFNYTQAVINNRLLIANHVSLHVMLVAQDSHRY